jgi:hypothetical protein
MESAKSISVIRVLFFDCICLRGWVLIPENVIYFYHEDYEGLEDILYWLHA